MGVGAKPWQSRDQAMELRVCEGNGFLRPELIGFLISALSARSALAENKTTQKTELYPRGGLNCAPKAHMQNELLYGGKISSSGWVLNHDDWRPY